MAGLEPASVEAVAALQGDTPDNDHELVPNYPAPDHQLGSNISSLAAAKRRQHRRQFLRRTIVRPPIASALPSLPAPLPRGLTIHDFFQDCFPPELLIDPSMLRFLFEKQLRKSDVSSAGRIVIPKIEAEMYLPTLDGRSEGVHMQLVDMYSRQIWNFKFRFWANNHSRMYIFDDTRDFIKVHKLVVGDSITVFQDYQSGNYLIGAGKNGVVQFLSHTTNNTVNANFPPVDEYGNSRLYYGTTNMNHYSIATDNTVNASLPAMNEYGSPLYYGTTDTNDYYNIATDNTVNANLPAMDEYGSPIYYGTTNMSDNSVSFYSGQNPENRKLDPSNEYSTAFYSGLNPEIPQIDPSNDYSKQNPDDPESIAFYSGLNQDNPQLDQSALLGNPNHQLSNLTDGNQQVLYNTTDSTVNAHLPVDTVDEYGFPIYCGTPDMNDYTIAFSSEAHPENPQPEPSTISDLLDFANLFE